MPTPKLTEDELLEAIRVVTEYGSVAEAARRLNIARPTLQHRYAAAKDRLAQREEVDNRAPEGHLVKGVSTLYDADGVVKAQWVKTNIDHQARLDALKEVIDALKADLPKAEPVPEPTTSMSALCNFYTFTDYHLGMLAWHREGGEDWDLGIAESLILAALVSMIERSPPAHTAVVNIQGDFLHTDGKVPVTPAHGHVLDADSRYPKIRKAAIRIIRQLVRECLERHSDVHLVIAEGNHDEEGTGWLADFFDVHYEDEPRVSVNDSALPFYVFEWGHTMLGIHHGHKVKNEALPLLFAAQFPESWGRTKRREIHCGHRHHRDEKEYNGVTVVQHPTLAARDAHAARGGWIADRAAWAITYHKKYGAVGRVMVTPEMVNG
jgi:hypothetical protein